MAEKRPMVSWEVQCEYCGISKKFASAESNVTLIEAAQESVNAGWRVIDEHDICPTCQNIRKQTFLEAIKIAENAAIYEEVPPKMSKDVFELREDIAKALREKAEE